MSVLKFFDRRFGRDGKRDGNGNSAGDEDGAKNVVAYEGGMEL